jgi:hypothetical protein
MSVPCDKVGPEFFDEARWCFRAHEIVAATPERIFEVFCDGPSWSRWAPPITDVEWTSPFPLEVGSTRTVTMVGDLVGHEEFIVWDPPRRMAFRFNEVSRPGVAAFAEDYRVHDLGDGRSLVEWAMAMVPAGPGARTFPATAPLMGVGLRFMLGRFRRYVESNPVLTGTAPTAEAVPS